MSSNIYCNPNRKPLLNLPIPVPEVRAFHRALPHYTPTPLVSLPSLAKELGVSHFLLKDESSRLGLPAFKILGASWATAKAVSKRLDIPISAGDSEQSPIQRLSGAAREADLTLYAATDGNHGRAVARMAGYLGVKAKIYVPLMVDQETIVKIESEGAHVEVVVWQGHYDQTVIATKGAAAKHPDGKGLLISDTALEIEEETPRWMVDGYQTLFEELDEQIAGITNKNITHVLTPLGVGSLCSATCSHFGRAGRAESVEVVTVEPIAAPCFKSSLEAGKIIPVETSYTICTGMCCGTVSVTAWPIMRDGVSMALAVEDIQVEKAMLDLRTIGVSAGPCGAATTAGARLLPNLGPDSVVVVLCTEGQRHYEMEDPKHKPRTESMS
jgi:diaminopropionate ammonia-lyase